MGNTSGNEQNFTNCINMHDDDEATVKSKEQHDEFGNIVFYYNKISDREIKIYNPDQKEIGSIKREMGFINQHYIISDENNKIVNYINIHNHCCSSVCSFLDSNKNLEGVVNGKNGFYITYEEFDNYNTRISTADIPLIHNGNPTLNEYDQYGNIAFKTKTMFIRRNRILKIFDSNGIEVNLNNKSLLNKGFTKIQMIYIINNIFI